MKTQNIAALLMEDCKTVGVVFNDNQNTIYTYKTNEEFEEGDFAVVISPQSKLKVVKVVQIHKHPMLDVDSGIDYKWIVQKIDKTNYNEVVQRESEFQDHLIELEQKAIRANAINMLVEKLGVKSKLIESAVNKLNGIS